MMGAWATGLQAQQPVSHQDSLNRYWKMIDDLMGHGLDVPTILANPNLVAKLAEQGYRKDSLLYYYKRTYQDTRVDSSALAAPYLGFVGKAYRDSVVLRWGPSDPVLWQKLNTTGYSLVRYEFVPDPSGRLSGIPDTNSRTVLVDPSKPIKPWPLSRIAATVPTSDSSAMIAAQALYGTTFGTDTTGGDLNFVDRKNNQNMRFGFALLMADRSKLAAELMGLRYTDRTVRPNKYYLYYLVPVGMSSSLQNYCIIKNDPDQNSKIVGLEAKAGDRQIYLHWPKQPNQFSGYWIERSADKGKTWEKLSKDQLLFIEDDKQVYEGGSRSAAFPELDSNKTARNYFIFTDSTVNDIDYQYRISAQTPFADLTDYTYARVKSIDLTPPPVPVILSQEVDDKTNIGTIQWTMGNDPKLLADLAGFTVWHAPKPDSVFEQISPLLPPGARSFSTSRPLEKEKTHYFILKARDRAGNESVTFPVYLHVVDDIAPAPPAKPDFAIDTNGVVTLVWEHNTEADLLGYRVFFANAPTDEPTQLTKEPIPLNVFKDTIELVTLSKKIYYWIQAVDKSHNRSDFSSMIEVKKPDRLPPTAPVLNTPMMNDSIIRFTWVPSSSTDVARYVVYRRLYQGGDDWKKLAEIPAPDTVFTDRTARIEQIWEYTLRAQDDSGLFSEFAFPVKGRRWFGGQISGVDKFQVKYDSTARAVQVSWTFKQPEYELLNGVEHTFYLYRAMGADPLSLYRILESNQTAFTDVKTDKQGVYNYALKVVYLNGKTGAVCDPKSVNVQRN
jgi:hypothetical protein